MADILSLLPTLDYSKLAAEKIARELETFKGDRYGNAVKKHVASVITRFCNENAKFAEAVYKTKRTLSDCVGEIMKGCGNAISDIDVYRGAVRNYFPNADIDFHMTITINGAPPTEEELNRVPEPPKKAEKKPAQKASPAKAPSSEAPSQPPAAAPVKEKPKAPEVIQLSLF